MKMDVDISSENVLNFECLSLQSESAEGEGGFEYHSYINSMTFNQNFDWVYALNAVLRNYSF